MFRIRVRAIVGVMIFLGYFLIYIVRYNLSVHIVDMAQISKRDENMPFTNQKRTKGLYKWMKHNSARSMVDVISLDVMKMAKLFSAYHIGYCICFPIFHNVCDRMGPTWVVGITGIISGILCYLTPAAAYYDFWVLFIVRIVEGFWAGAMQPGMVQVLRYWVPPIERNHFMWAYCGITTGTCSTFLLCAAVQFYAQWPLGFYISGAAQIVWAALWTLIETDHPRAHSFISKEELDYLINTIGTIFNIKLTNSQAPWKLILKSIPFWALCMLNFGYAWMIISLCIHGPLYYSRVIKYNIYSEITPNFVNSLTTVIKIIGNTSGIIVSLVVGQVTQSHNNTPYIWKHIWCFHAAVLFCSGFIFLCWGETEVQSWNYQRRTFQRNNVIGPQPSTMSNIIEVHEYNNSTRTSLSKNLQK